MKAPIKLENYIDGRFVPPAGAEFLDDLDPATGRVIGHIARGNAADDALFHAAAGFGPSGRPQRQAASSRVHSASSQSDSSNGRRLMSCHRIRPLASTR